MKTMKEEIIAIIILIIIKENLINKIWFRAITIKVIIYINQDL